MRSRANSFIGLFGLFFLLSSASTLAAATITVRQDGSGDYTSIGDAVSAASAFDTIDVGPGTYYEEVDLYIPLSFVSRDGATATIVDGLSSKHHFWFFNAPGSSVDGFTFVNGYNFSGGASIRVQGGATVQIRNCVFKNNHSDFDGGALFARDSGSIMDVEDCLLENNFAANNGGAAQCILGSVLRFTRCQFIQNSTNLRSGSAGCDRSTMDVVDCLFWGNTSTDITGGLYYHLALGGLIKNNTFYGNASPGSVAGSVVIHNSATTTVTQNVFANDVSGYGLRYFSGGGTHTCNVFWGNADGPSNEVLDSTEIVADPLFCDAVNGDFGLSGSSPAAPSNNSCGGLVGAFPVACGPPPVQIDIKPGSCRNPFPISVFSGPGRNHGKGGALPVAVIGAVQFDVRQIDPATIRLEGVSPTKTALEDVSGPSTDGGENSCACPSDGGDGFLDLMTFFEKSEIAAAIGPGHIGDERTLTMTGQLNDGTPFSAADCIVFVGREGHESTDNDSNVSSPSINGDVVFGESFPNPFNPSTRIRFALPDRAFVVLSVYDVNGRVVEELAARSFNAGTHTIEWNAGGHSSGIYFARLRVDDRARGVNKLILIK